MSSAPVSLLLLLLLRDNTPHCLARPLSPRIAPTAMVLMMVVVGWRVDDAVLFSKHCFPSHAHSTSCQFVPENLSMLLAAPSYVVDIVTMNPY